MPRHYAPLRRQMTSSAPYKRGRKALKRKMTVPKRYKGLMRTGGNYGRFNIGPGSEIKEIDKSVEFLFDATGEVPTQGQLAEIAQGTDFNERLGRSCIVKSIHIRANLSFQPGAGSVASNLCHLYVVQDTQANGAAATRADIFTHQNLSKAHLQIKNRKRFKILSHKSWQFSSTAGVATSFGAVTKQCDIKLNNLNICMTFDSTTGAIGEKTTNNIFLVAGAAHTTEDDLVDFEGRVRIQFSDKTY